jgi:hypothetical protein
VFPILHKGASDPVVVCVCVCVHFMAFILDISFTRLEGIISVF